MRTRKKKSRESENKLITKRRFLGALLISAAALPIGRVVLLKSMDNPLPKFAAPEVIYVDGWVLEVHDVEPDNTG